MSFSVTRRQALLSAAAAPAALTIGGAAFAGGHQAAELAQPKARGAEIGDFKVTTLLDTRRRNVEEPQGTFGMNVSAEEFAKVSEENFIPSDKTDFFFTPVVVETGSDVVLFDTGLGQGGIVAALSDAGLTPDDVTVVVITHMHPDHIGGLTNDAGAVFKNARYYAGQAEYDFWQGQGEGNRIFDLMATKVVPLVEKITFVGDGAEVVPGITGMAAAGHTPGHMVYRIENGGQQFMLLGDLANHAVWSLAHPDWEVRFDMDKAAAAASRRKVLGMLAADRIPFSGYHMPFPAMGYVEANGDGFRYVPVSYQL